jgi:antitoxin (DNA-binding transcriptional repressor) of toxin-antitoxin stability system
MDRVAESGEPIVITKRGRPVAMLTPARDSSQTAPGFFKGRMEIAGDIVGPLNSTALDVDWGPAEPKLRPARKKRRT